MINILSKYGYLARVYFDTQDTEHKPIKIILTTYFIKNHGYSASIGIGKKLAYVFHTRLHARLAISQILQRNQGFISSDKKMIYKIEKTI